VVCRWESAAARESWGVSVLHRTLIQTADDRGPAAAAFARLLARLDLVSATGVITTSRAAAGASAARGEQLVERSGPIRFHLTPSPSRTRPAHQP